MHNWLAVSIESGNDSFHGTCRRRNTVQDKSMFSYGTLIQLNPLFRTPNNQYGTGGYTDRLAGKWAMPGSPQFVKTASPSQPQ
jgi:hypothetical protein